MKPRVIACALLALAAASSTRAAPLLLRTKGPQIDEAVVAFKSEIGEPVVEVQVDEASSVEAIVNRATDAKAGIVVAIGARAAQLALKQTLAPVVHCMVLQDAASFDTDRSVGVPLAVPPKAQLEMLKRLAPQAKNVGVLFDPKLSTRQIEELSAAARAANLILLRGSVGAATEGPAALDKLLPDVDALLLIPDATVVSKELVTFLVGRSFDRRVPVLAYSESIVKVGALAALAPQYAQNGKQCARLAKRVLAGETPASLHNAVEMSGQLVVNVATARKIGVNVPAELLKPPTQVVGQ